jgi:hypothetical protein
MSIKLFFSDKPFDYGPYPIMGPLTMTTTKVISDHFAVANQIGMPWNKIPLFVTFKLWLHNHHSTPNGIMVDSHAPPYVPNAI